MAITDNYCIANWGRTISICGQEEFNEPQKGVGLFIVIWNSHYNNSVNNRA
jgi:hypothetical protein